MITNIKSLVEKLSDQSRSALEGAAGLCLSKTNYDVDVEHLLLKIIEISDSDIEKIIKHYNLNRSAIIKELTYSLDRLKTGNARTPSLSPQLIKLLQTGWLIASIDYKGNCIRTGHLLISLLRDEELGRLVREISPTIYQIPYDDFRQNFLSIITGSLEDRAQLIYDQKISNDGGDSNNVMRQTAALDQYTIDLTQKARSQMIDPVIGRDFEIRQLVDILTRRRQNNPILTGEAGVGKTAVVEGFAQKVVSGDVPQSLLNVSIRTLDLGLLQAGAGIKGEFENRLKNVINEVKASPQPIILFIDEAHTMIGAGGAAGQNDAANLLKPALARGELRTIAATTWAEYKKYFEKDAALARRFQVVKVDEPNEETAIVMMRGLISKLETHHSVRVLDEAVIDSVKLSHRYLTGRQLPDKAVSVLDTACARVSISRESTPSIIEDTVRQIAKYADEIASLQRESITGANHTARLLELNQLTQSAEASLKTLQLQLANERTLISDLKEVRDKLENLSSLNEIEPSEINDLKDQFESLTDQLKQIQGELPLLQPFVSTQSVADVISGWTGIPVGKMMSDEINSIIKLESRLENRVIRQEHALHTLSQTIRTARANLTDPRRPIGVFLLVGPSGVGKTETALALSDILYGGEKNIISINMSEYQEAHTVSTLKGSPPGYVGYGEGGVLSEAVRRKPYSVVLLDEVEKAHTDVMELFYQVFDKGVLEDGEGREIDFKNTIILLTSNIGLETIHKLCVDPETRPEPDGLAVAIRPELIKHFKPALLGRMIVVPYYPITDTVLRRIINLQLNRIAERLNANHRATLQYGDDVIEEIANRCREVESGARNVDQILTHTVLPSMSGLFLQRMAVNDPIHQVAITVGPDKNFTYTVS
jgi:type VI secretion system protein VasG